MIFWDNFFGLEGVMEKCVGCFLVGCIPILGWFFLIKNRGMCNHLKKRIFTSFLCVFMVEKGIYKKGVLGSCKDFSSSFVNAKIFQVILGKSCFNVKCATYFHVKTKILADFQICVSMPLRSTYFSPYF